MNTQVSLSITAPNFHAGESPVNPVQFTGCHALWAWGVSRMMGHSAWPSVNPEGVNSGRFPLAHCLRAWRDRRKRSPRSTERVFRMV